MDSSGWLEIVSGGANAKIFLEVIDQGELVVPSITIFEVTKRVRIFGSSTDAAKVESHMRRFTVIDLTADRASEASLLSSRYKLPMAGSIIYACALEFNATVWTQDEDFKGLAQVKYLAKVLKK